MKISLLHPSRGRPLQALNTYSHWIMQSSKDNVIEHILSLDSDDISLNEYHSFFHSSKFIIAPNKNLVEAANIGAKETTGDIIVLLSDDFECYKNWDVDIVNVFLGMQKLYSSMAYVLKTNDGCEDWIVTLPIMGREYYLMQGYIYHPDTKHLFCDTIQTHKAELEGRLIVRKDFVFNHRHPMYDKSIPMDDVYKRSNASWEQGKAIYLREVRNSFGLKDVDVFNLSLSAQNHIQWLKKELK